MDGPASAGPFRSSPPSPFKHDLAGVLHLDDPLPVDETGINFAGDETEMKAAVREKGPAEADPLFTSR
jgi:hypothetical protein